jgi:VCBS repeat-containing protein
MRAGRGFRRPGQHRHQHRRRRRRHRRSFGTLTVNANGSFNYVVNNANTTVQGLNVGGTLTDTFTYTMRDTDGATDNALVTFTINGANDAPVAVNDGSAATPAYIAFEGSALVVTRPPASATTTPTSTT